MKNNKIIIGMIFIVFILNTVLAIDNNPYYYNFNLNYNNGNLEISSIKIEFYEGVILNLHNSGFNSYYLKIMNKQGNVLEKLNFSVPNFVLYDYGDENGNYTGSEIVELENVSFNVYVPYYENAYQVVVYDRNEVEIEKDLLSQFSKTGFDIKDFKEITDEGVSEDKKEVISENKGISDKFNKSDSKYIIISLIILLIALIVVGIVSIVKKKWK
ncbi:MAG: hypothetical protein ABIH37_03675 [archaeon]